MSRAFYFSEKFSTKQEKSLLSEVYQKYTMETTTIKVHQKTKSELDALRSQEESYDQIISRLITHIQRKELQRELIVAYKSMGKKDLELLEEWESSSAELD